MVEVKKTSKKVKKTVAKKVEEPTVVENKEESTAAENKEETTAESVLGESKAEESDNEEIKETIDEAIKEDLNKIAEDKKDEVTVKAGPIVEHKTENKPTNKSKIIRNFTATWNGVTMDY